MSKAYKFPLSPKAQSFFARLGSKRYLLTWRFNSAAQSWMLSIADENKNPILSSIPVVTGLDLLAPYRYTGIEGSIVVQTDHNADAVPTYANLGQDGNVYYVVSTQ
jgi:hypothetical protein